MPKIYLKTRSMNKPTKWKFTLYKYKDFKLIETKIVTISRVCRFVAKNYLYKKYPEFQLIELN